MLKRVVSGVGVAIAFLLLFTLGNAWVLVALVLALHIIAQDEFRRLCAAGGIPVETWAVPICGAAYLVATAIETPFFQTLYGEIEDGRIFSHFNVAPSEIILWLAPALFLAIGVLRRRTARALESFALSLASLWYTAVLLGFLVRLTLQWQDLHTGRLVLIYTLVVVKMSDAGAYFIGMRFGRGGPRLIPEISPAKSIAGLVGGYAFGIASSLLAALVAHAFLGGSLGSMPLPWRHAAILGVLLPTAGCFGDLAESLFKRSVNVKDSASFVPGLGGFLDMLDSPLFAAPFMYLYMRLFIL